ncbi:MAG: hypothetical protein M3270_00585 [Thermoproteota archaeon]|nr:hypothetical protein [Thermoproteota archaeon]
MTIIDLLAIIVVAPIPLTAVEAQTASMSTTRTTTAATTTILNNNTSDTNSSGIELSQHPVIRERVRTVSETPINDAYMSTTYTGNGTLTLTNNPIDTIANFTSNGSALISFVTQTVQGMETLKTENGQTATFTFYEIVKFNPATHNAAGIITAEIHTNPFGTLAPLNDMVVIGIDDILSNGESNVTFWEWESRISNLDIVPLQDELDIDKILNS